MSTVLVVDDNKLNQLIAAGTLKRLGYEVEVVDSGFEAVEACTARWFDAILMDVTMPGMDGIEAARRIRTAEASRGGRPTPVIGLSARAVPGDRETALASGMDDYLNKPVREDELGAALQRWTLTAPSVDLTH